MKRKHLIFVVLLLFFCACEEKNQPEQPADGQTSISCTPITKTVTNANEQFIVTLKSNAPWSATVDQAWVSISPNNGQGDAYVTIKTLGACGVANVLFSNGKGSTTFTIMHEEYSVGASKKVQFSRGNLQYQARSDTWRFAANQYDFIFNNNTPFYHIPYSYDDWIDLFCWGTGDNPMKYSFSNYDFNVFVDWGTNAISNGGNKANLWRTLTEDEWTYLLCARKNAANLFGLGNVNGINGLIILHDNWITPSGLTFLASTTLGLENIGDRYYNNNNYGNFSHNTYTLDQWSTMETAGAVFLPAAGGGYGTDVTDMGYGGWYWSSIPDGNAEAFVFSFNDVYLWWKSSVRRSTRLPVRLVKDIE